MQTTHAKGQERTVLFYFPVKICNYRLWQQNDVIESYYHLDNACVYINAKIEQVKWQISSWHIWGNILNMTHKPLLQSLGWQVKTCSDYDLSKHNKLQMCVQFGGQARTYKAPDCSHLLFLSDPGWLWIVASLGTQIPVIIFLVLFGPNSLMRSPDKNPITGMCKS